MLIQKLCDVVEFNYLLPNLIDLFPLLVLHAFENAGSTLVVVFDVIYDDFQLIFFDKNQNEFQPKSRTPLVRPEFLKYYFLTLVTKK